MTSVYSGFASSFNTYNSHSQLSLRQHRILQSVFTIVITSYTTSKDASSAHCPVVPFFQLCVFRPQFLLASLVSQLNIVFHLRYLHQHLSPPPRHPRWCPTYRCYPLSTLFHTCLRLCSPQSLGCSHPGQISAQSHATDLHQPHRCRHTTPISPTPHYPRQTHSSPHKPSHS